jgi:inward rectifier potassium channel
MAETQVPFDPGLSQKYTGTIRRTINPDGSFNVERRGVHLWKKDAYHYLISVSWTEFLGVLIGGYFTVNLVFGLAYILLGIEHLHGASITTPGLEFLSAFFFSAQTFTTVGYGGISPEGVGTNVVASFEAALGLLGFALAAALFYGRFSRPNSRLVFSRFAIVAPYQGVRSLQFRIVNERPNLLMELQASVILMTVESRDGQQPGRVYHALELERSGIQFLPLTWTIVHPIGEGSPLSGRTLADLSMEQAEILVQIKAYDDAFSQYVHARHSYRFDEIQWGARFLPAFRTTEDGDVLVDVDRVHDMERVALDD